jgi:hypothetical protein
LFLLGDDTENEEVCTIQRISSRIGRTHRRWGSGYINGLVIQRMLVQIHSQYNYKIALKKQHANEWQAGKE